MPFPITTVPSQVIFCFLCIMPAAILQAYRGYDYHLYEPQHQGKLYARFKTETPHLANRIENWSPPARFRLFGCELIISSSITTSVQSPITGL